MIQGETRIGERGHCEGAHCVIERASSATTSRSVPPRTCAGDCRLGDGCRIGNFVEVKNSVLGPGVKADHLSYIGDADVGEGASFGCGAITVNYDWSAKHRTTVEAGAFVGCNVNLIAPVTRGEERVDRGRIHDHRRTFPIRTPSAVARATAATT